MVDYCSVKDVVARWHVSERFVRELIAAGTLPAVKLSPKVLRIRLADVEAFESRSAA